MSFFNEEMLSMLDIYLAETNELLADFANLVAAGSEQHTLTREQIQEFFRVFHTVKSSSAMMGLSDLSKLSHGIEDLFNIYRDRPQLVNADFAKLLDLLDAYSDYVQGELDRMTAPDFQPVSAAKLLTLVQKEVQILTAAQDKHAQAQVAVMPGGQESLAAGPAAKGGRLLVLYFVPDCAMVNVRALVILKQLQTRVKVVATEPAVLQELGCSADIFQQGFRIYVAAEVPPALLERLRHNSYLSRVVYNGLQIKGDTVAAVPHAADSTSAAAKAAPAAFGDSTSVNAGTAAPAAVTAEIAAPNQAAAEAGLEHVQDKYISVHWGAVVALQNLTGELLTNYAILSRRLATQLGPSGFDEFAEGHQRLLEELEATVQHISMISVAKLVPQLSRTVREICKAEGKKVDFSVQGTEIEIDRNLFDNIAKPLLHIIRNAVDHGIEAAAERQRLGKSPQGKITLTIAKLGGRVAFALQDDGKGMEPYVLLKKAQEKGLLQKELVAYTKQEALNLIMLPGFSTKEKVTEFSGRGVGMDVVNSLVSSLGGTVTIESTAGEGTVITMRMPVSVTTVESMGLTVGESRYFLPLWVISKVYDQQQVQALLCLQQQAMFLHYEEQLVPVLDLRTVFGLPSGTPGAYVVVQSLHKCFCLVVDCVDGQQLTAEKPLPWGLSKDYQQRSGISGCVILENGRIGYMLSVERLYALSRKGRAADAN